MFKVFLCVLIIHGFDIQLSNGANQTIPLPIVLWHGMGDSSFFGLSSFKFFLQQSLGPNSYIISLRFGKNAIEDRKNSFLMHPNKQVEQACHMIASDEKFKNGYNAVGFSQAGQFIRAVAQRCPEPRMHNLISLGGQHQGVYGLPNCPIAMPERTCNWIRKLLSVAAYLKFVQNRLVQATYWHDPLKEEKYRHSSTFLAEINNEVTINRAYVDNLKKLNKMVLVKFLNDTQVNPIDSQWFQFYTPNQAKEIQEFSKSNAAKNLGLNDLVTAKKIDFVAVEGNHLQFTQEWFKKNLMQYLNGKI